MKKYTFTCPLEGCGFVMMRDGESNIEGVQILSNIAEQHLRNIHPDIHKTREEIEEDIQSNMVIS